MQKGKLAMETIKSSKYTHRYIARFIIEAETPMAIGSGERSIETDAMVVRDVNGLPYLQRTTIAGVIRSMLHIGDKNDLWGYQSASSGHGSEITFTDGRILNSRGSVIDGMLHGAFEDPLLKYYDILPVRQHVRITEQGVAASHGKFDEQVVFAGTRFCFEMEVASDGSNWNEVEEIISATRKCTFRIGSGSRSGFGKIKVISVSVVDINLKEQADLYLTKSSNLQESVRWRGWSMATIKEEENNTLGDALYVTYRLTLQPRDFIFFGSGLQDEDGNADITTVKAKRVIWTNGVGKMEENLLLIPATSLKGALRHRIAYRYNQRKGIFADQTTSLPNTENEAVRILFGYEDQALRKQQRGNVLFSDIIESPVQSHLFNHVSIDQFTGGTINGALFTEQVDYVTGRTFSTDIQVRKDVLADDDVKFAFETAIDDLCKGLLPLGGGTSRGHGLFCGNYQTM